MILHATALQSPTPQETIVFHQERPGLPVPVFTLTVHPDGTAIYQASYAPEIPRYSPYAASLRLQPNTEVTANVTLTPATTARLFDEVRSTHDFAAGCASKAKNIASTGKKSLTYTSPAGSSTCRYDYADDKTIATLTAAFQGIALTLDEGRKLELKHRYDRLALDPETEYLVSAVQNGSAVEISTISPTLRSIADDPQVLERVRTRAAALLSHAAGNNQAP